jgi:hypothetical protein
MDLRNHYNILYHINKNKNMKKYLEKFNNFLNIKSPFDKKVELNIMDYDTEEILTSIIVDKETASKICQALYTDRKNGGQYGGYFDENKVL